MNTNEGKIYTSPECCYQYDNDENNPLRGRLYVGADGNLWISSEGQGCVNDYTLDDIDGWTPADINDVFRGLDLDVLSRDADRIRQLGRHEDADWLRNWIETAEAARRGVVVELAHMGSEATEEDREKFIEALHREGYTWARSARDGEEGDTSGITDQMWDYIMHEAFN